MRIESQRPRLKIGDKVRVYLHRDAFAKGYFPNFSKEIFTVYKIYHTSPFPKYRVKDKKNNIVRGSYYYEELKKII